MRQHVNPLSSNFNQIKRIPSLTEMFGNSKLNLHLDIGCAAGEFLFDLALVNTSWNYLGIEIREKLVKTAKLKVKEREIISFDDDNKKDTEGARKIMRMTTRVSMKNKNNLVTVS